MPLDEGSPRRAQPRPQLAVVQQQADPVRQRGGITGRHDEAVPWLERAKTAPRYEPRQFPYFNLARVYVKQNRVREAIAELRQALTIEPRYELARRELTRLQSQLSQLN